MTRPFDVFKGVYLSVVYEDQFSLSKGLPFDRESSQNVNTLVGNCSLSFLDKIGR